MRDYKRKLKLRFIKLYFESKRVIKDLQQQMLINPHYEVQNTIKINNIKSNLRFMDEAFDSLSSEEVQALRIRCNISNGRQVRSTIELQGYDCLVVVKLIRDALKKLDQVLTDDVIN